MRHAKSDWNTHQADFDRPLNEHGKKDAPFMGQELIKRGLIPDLIVSSPAKRAKTTAVKVAKACNYDKENIVWEESFYESTEQNMFNYIKKLPADKTRVLLIGHNPTIEYLTGMLIESKKEIIVTTANIIVLNYLVNWQEIDYFKAKLDIILRPKELRV